MRKGLAKALEDDMRPEYDLAKLKGGVRGKYYEQARAVTNLVLIEPDLWHAFPDAASVNRALRLLLNTANAARSGSLRPRTESNKRLKRPTKNSAVAQTPRSGRVFSKAQLDILGNVPESLPSRNLYMS
jgi:hypothetical protein